ncbi:MAG: tetratricopeptide repeat protein [Candidatus Eremiobacterota bacterium]
MKNFLFYSPVTHIVYIYLISIIVFSNSFHNAYQLDDFHTVVNNPAIRHIHPVWRHFTDPSTIGTLPGNISYRPLLPLSLSLTYAVWGYNVVGYHMYNLFFHIGASIFLYLFFLELLTFNSENSENKSFYRVISFFGVLLFSIHPISGFCVNYICGRDNIMMQAFLALSLYIYTKMRKSKETPLKWAAVIFFFLLALLSKIMVLIVPFLILEFELIMAKSSIRSWKTWARVLAFQLSVLFVWLYVRFGTIIYGTTAAYMGTSPKERLYYLMTQFKMHLFYYLRNFIYPFPVRGLPDCEVVTSPADIKMIIGFIFIVFTIIAAWHMRKKLPLLSFSIAAYWTMFIPSSSIFPLFQYIADRWMYPSLPYLTLVVSLLVFRYVKNRKIAVSIVTVISLYFCITSYVMNTHWKDAISFNSQSVKYGTNEIGYLNLGVAYLKVDSNKAKYYYEKTVKKYPRYYLAHINLGFWYINHGEKEKGLAIVKKGLDLTPRGSKSTGHYWYAKALEETGRKEEAFLHFKKSIEVNRNPNDKYFYYAGINASSTGKYKEAIEYFEKYLNINPGNEEVKKKVSDCKKFMKK